MCAFLLQFSNKVLEIGRMCMLFLMLFKNQIWAISCGYSNFEKINVQYSRARIKGLKLRCNSDWTGNWTGKLQRRSSTTTPVPQ